LVVGRPVDRHPDIAARSAGPDWQSLGRLDSLPQASAIDRETLIFKGIFGYRFRMPPLICATCREFCWGERWGAGHG